MPVGTKNCVVEGCGLHHIALQTRDLDESLKLYRDVLGMTEVTVGGPPDRKIVLLDMGDGSCIELFAPKVDASGVEPPVGSTPFLHIALTSTDIYAALERVRGAGYEVTKGPLDGGLGELAATIAFFNGPSGEVIELWQPRCAP